MYTAVNITLTDEERAELQRLSRGRSVQARLVLRAKIVLAAATVIVSIATNGPFIS